MFSVDELKMRSCNIGSFTHGVNHVYANPLLSIVLRYVS